VPDAHLLRGSEPQVRARWSCQVQPYLDAIEWLERAGVAYDWHVSMTGQDYPVTPVARIEAFLDASEHDGYLRFWDVLSGDGPWSRHKARHRYWHRHARLPEWTRPLLRILRPLARVLPVHVSFDYGVLVGVRTPTPFGPSLRCHGGWAWHSLRRRAVLHVRDFLAAHPEVVRHYRGVMAPEESLVPTILANAGCFDLVDDDLRYIDYSSARAGHPRVLTEADVPLLASGRYHFARKFDVAVDRRVLDRIDHELLGLAASATHPGADATRGPGADAATHPGADAARGPGADATRGPGADAARGAEAAGAPVA
jgi:hypothetical protein